MLRPDKYSRMDPLLGRDDAKPAGLLPLHSNCGLSNLANLEKKARFRDTYSLRAMRVYDR